MVAPSSLYTSGDIILDNPIESAAVFVAVVVLAACIEYLFTIATEIQSKFYRAVFDTIAEEVLVVGFLSLLLTFGTSLFTSLPASWAVMLQWTHVCLLFLGILFIVLKLVLVGLMITTNRKWKKFETSRMVSNPSLAGRDLRFKQSHARFVVACVAHRVRTDVCFADYLLKVEKHNMIALGDLTWKSWVALSVAVVINALRTLATPTHPSATDPNKLLSESDAMINIGVFIALIGYGTMGIFLYVHFLLQRRARQYLLLQDQPAEIGADPTSATGLQATLLDANRRKQPANRHGADDNGSGLPPAAVNINPNDLDDPQSFLIWQRNSSTMALLQICLMFYMWYGAIFALNMFYATFSFNAGFTLLYLLIALVPFFVFIGLTPWTLTTVAILSSLGANLNLEWIKELGDAADIRAGKLVAEHERYTAKKAALAAKHASAMAPKPKIIEAEVTL